MYSIRCQSRAGQYIEFIKLIRILVFAQCLKCLVKIDLLQRAQKRLLSSDDSWLHYIKHKHQEQMKLCADSGLSVLKLIIKVDVSSMSYMREPVFFEYAK